MKNRTAALHSWAQKQIAELCGEPEVEVAINHLSGDASFRTYYRAVATSGSKVETYIITDSPAESEDNEAFVKIAAALRKAGLNTPQVYSVEMQQGFILQEDFGDNVYLQAFKKNYAAPDEIDRLYKLAIDSLVQLQKQVDRTVLPAYDHQKLLDEMSLFSDWFCEKYLGLDLSDNERNLIAQCYEFLAQHALEQTQVAVHRDYHSRNLMIPETDKSTESITPGVIDFQDAVSGPYTYDLVSLLRDCYISWPQPYVEFMALYYKEQAQRSGVIKVVDDDTFFRDFDLMGLQRNLKVIGIFSRLFLRDNKSGYLADIPQVIRYFLDVATNYRELDKFVAWFTESVLPVADEKFSTGELCEQ
jgi:aminoglycoside/choline kinase family phosphotransferase